jgi:hypothetical protein
MAIQESAERLMADNALPPEVFREEREAQGLNSKP